MAPKFKFTKDKIIREATELVRQSGKEALTARMLAEKLCSSVKPIFTLFDGMGEVKREVLKYANSLYGEHIKKHMESGEFPPYKASGMAYILFAKEERELFKLLFMRDRSAEMISEDREAIRPILCEVMKSTGFSEDEAYLFHLEMWIFVHGIASMAANSYLTWDMDFVSSALSDIYMGLKYRFSTKENKE